jgi:hypothetical protein
MLSGLIAQANFNPINAIDARITRRSPPEDLDACPGEESKMRQIIAHFVWEIDAF